jgi:hypothetical protein
LYLSWSILLTKLIIATFLCSKLLLKCIWRAFEPLSVVVLSKKNYASLHFLYGVDLYIVFNAQLKEVVDTLKDDAPHLDSILMHMGNMYAALNKFEDSLDTYQRAVYIVERIYGECTFPLAMFFMFMICFHSIREWVLGRVLEKECP